MSAPKSAPAPRGPRCEVSWPTEPDGCEAKHGRAPTATHLVSWSEKRRHKSNTAGGAGGQDYAFLCCEEHAIAAQAWGNVSVYRLELVDSPEGLSRGEEPGE